MNSALVVGEGIAGLATAVELLELGAPVVLLAREPAEHAESTHRHDGVEAALGDDDDPARHADDLVALAGEAARPFLQAMTQAAPALVERLERLDVPFERTRKGELARVMLTGSSRARSHHAGALTARHVSRRLAALALRHEALERHVGWSVVDLVLDDDGVARGVVAQCFATGEQRAFAADGVCFAGGGHAGLFHADTLAPPGLGGLTGLALRHGDHPAMGKRPRNRLNGCIPGFANGQPKQSAYGARTCRCVTRCLAPSCLPGCGSVGRLR